MAAARVGEASQTRSASFTINRWYRAAAVLLGLGGLGSGGIAVFVTHLEAGPVALLLVGLVLLMIGMGGRLPSRIKIGDNEAAWEAVGDFVERVADGTPKEARLELVDALNELAAVAPDVAAVGLSTVAYKTQVVDMIHGVISTIPDRDGQLVYRLADDNRADRSDLYLESSGRIVLVEIHSSTSMLSPDSVDYLLRHMSDLAGQQHKAVAALLVSRTVLPADVLRLVGQRDDISHVVVTGTQDFDRLEKAIRNAIGLPWRS
jgi:hypothetical protein